MTRKAEVQRSIPVYINVKKKLEVYLLERERRRLIKGRKFSKEFRETL